MKRILFVCLGNICRSPTAHAVFEHLLEREGLAHVVSVDSAGTGDWHVGRPPDARASAAAFGRGYQMDHLRARQFGPDDFDAFDYILAMDDNNLSDILAQAPDNHDAQVKLFLEFGREYDEREVPDPYYGGDAGFEHVLNLIEDASRGLLEHLRHEGVK